MTLSIAKHHQTIFTLVQEEGPHDVMSFLEMLEALKEVENDSLWGLVIRRVIDQNGSMDELIAGLASQAQDDPLTMAGAIGPDLTVAVLRTLLKD